MTCTQRALCIFGFFWQCTNLVSTQWKQGHHCRSKACFLLDGSEWWPVKRGKGTQRSNRKHAAALDVALDDSWAGIVRVLMRDIWIVSTEIYQRSISRRRIQEKRKRASEFRHKANSSVFYAELKKKNAGRTTVISSVSPGTRSVEPSWRHLTS